MRLNPVNSSSPRPVNRIAHLDFDKKNQMFGEEAGLGKLLELETKVQLMVVDCEIKLRKCRETIGLVNDSIEACGAEIIATNEGLTREEQEVYLERSTLRIEMQFIEEREKILRAKLQMFPDFTGVKELQSLQERKKQIKSMLDEVKKKEPLGYMQEKSSHIEEDIERLQHREESVKELLELRKREMRLEKELPFVTWEAKERPSPKTENKLVSMEAEMDFIRRRKEEIQEETGIKQVGVVFLKKELEAIQGEMARLQNKLDMNESRIIDRAEEVVEATDSILPLLGTCFMALQTLADLEAQEKDLEERKQKIEWFLDLIQSEIQRRREAQRHMEQLQKYLTSQENIVDKDKGRRMSDGLLKMINTKNNSKPLIIKESLNKITFKIPQELSNKL